MMSQIETDLDKAVSKRLEDQCAQESQALMELAMSEANKVGVPDINHVLGLLIAAAHVRRIGYGNRRS